MNDLHRDLDRNASPAPAYPEFDAQALHDLRARSRAEGARQLRQGIRDACALLWRSCAQVWRGVRAGLDLMMQAHAAQRTRALDHDESAIKRS